jgi:predicted transcriptional regulator
MSNFSFETDHSLASRLARLAERHDVSSAEIVEVAVAEFIEREESQIAEIEAAIEEAERGDFASDDEVAAVFGRYAASPPVK